MKGIYLTPEGKQEIENKIAELEKGWGSVGTNTGTFYDAEVLESEYSKGVIILPNT